MESDGGVKTTKGGVVHPKVDRAIAKIGADISHARRVRRIAAEDFARRIGISRATLHRLENGDPGISLNTLAMALHAIGRLDALANIADAANDHITMMQMRDQAPRRISKPRIASPVHENIDDEPAEALPSRPENKFKGF
ncbi:helix-turn-helix transcriptional regulator [Agrobacterium salinitolerans]|nr:helix-turn-helix transcriptional regulator [Agrobacterium salinitolerans]